MLRTVAGRSFRSASVHIFADVGRRLRLIGDVLSVLVRVGQLSIVVRVIIIRLEPSSSTMAFVTRRAGGAI